MKRTLERELKVPAIAETEANWTSLLGKIVACRHQTGTAWCEQTVSFGGNDKR